MQAHSGAISHAVANGNRDERLAQARPRNAFTVIDAEPRPMGRTLDMRFVVGKEGVWLPVEWCPLMGTNIEITADVISRADNKEWRPIGERETLATRIGKVVERTEHVAVFGRRRVAHWAVLTV